MKEVLAKLDKIDSKINDIDKRLVANETKMKIIFPIFTLFFVTMIDFVKTKFGLKG